MKMTIKLLSTTLALLIIASSCSIHIEKRHHRKGYFVNINNGRHKTKTAKVEKSESNKKTTTDKKSSYKNMPEVKISNPANLPLPITVSSTETEIIDTPAYTAHKVSSEKVNTNKIEISSENISTLKTFKQLTKSIKDKEDKSSSGGDLPIILIVILAIIIPPLSVYFMKDISGDFWLNLVLALLGVGVLLGFVFSGIFWLAAVVHALLIAFEVI